MFKGHNFIKIINGNWVFDMTEFVGYKVDIDNKTKKFNYTKAFTASLTEENNVEFKKFLGIPIKVLKETNRVINKYVQVREC